MGRTDHSVNAMYRSVPPRPLSYTFSDILQTSLEPRKLPRSKTAPVSTNTPEEYAERFKSRPTTRPAVIDLDGTGVKMYFGHGLGCRQLNAPSYPVVRTKNSLSLTARPRSPETPPPPLTERGTTCTTGLHLAPLGKDMASNSALSLKARHYKATSLQPHAAPPRSPELTRFYGLRSAASSVRSRVKSSGSSGQFCHGDQHGQSAGSSVPRAPMGTSEGQHWQELSSSKLSTLDTQTLAVTPRVAVETAGYAEALARSDDYDDLTDLPRPKRILPRRDLPWVFRFKVKKEMNALSKIMASKPSISNPISPAGPVA